MSGLRGYAAYEPNEATVMLLDQCGDIIDDNRAYLPISLRQLFYLGVSAYGWPKTEKFYKGLCSKMTRARRAGIISFAHIRDDGIHEEEPVVYRDREHLLNVIEGSIESFTIDHMPRQDRDVVIWTEGRGLVPMVQQFTEQYDVPIITSGGFDGVTLKHQIAQRFRRRPAVVLHVGDYDPSGEVMFKALAEDVEAFGGKVEFRRIAVTRPQIDDNNLPTKPPKRGGNTHALSFDDDITVELEAMPPPVLRRTLEDALVDVLDWDVMKDAQEESVQVREELLETLGLR